MTYLRRWRGGCDWCWAVYKKTCSQLILTVTTMVTSACHAMVTKHKQHCVILHQLGDIPEKRNEVNMFTALVTNLLLKIYIYHYHSISKLLIL